MSIFKHTNSFSEIAKRRNVSIQPIFEPKINDYPTKPNFLQKPTTKSEYYDNQLSPLPDYDSKYDNDSDYGETQSLVTTPASVLTPTTSPSTLSPDISPRFQVEGESTPKFLQNDVLLEYPGTPRTPETPLQSISPLSPLTPTGCEDDEVIYSDELSEKRMQERQKCLTIKEIYNLYDKWFDEDESENVE